MSTTPEINVELVLPSGKVVGLSAIPASHTATVVITEMCEFFHLPVAVGPNRVPYELFWEQQGRALPMDQTLLDAGVQEGNRLQLRGGNAKEEGHVPEEPTGNEDEVPVTLSFMVDTYSQDSVKRNLRYDDTVASVIQQLVKQLNLPQEDRGQRIAYEISSKAVGKLLPGVTLRKMKIPKHDALTLTADKTAG